MCNETLNNLFNLYYNNIDNENMLKLIAFKAADEAVKTNKMEDVVALFDCEVFSEKFRKSLVKGFTKFVGLDNPVCVNLICKENVDFDVVGLDELKNVSDKFTLFKNNYNSNLFRTIDHSLKDYVLEESIKRGDLDYVKDFIRKNENYTYIRSKFLNQISKNISNKEFNELNHIIQDDLLCETKGIPKKIIEKRETGALKHLI